MKQRQDIQKNEQRNSISTEPVPSIAKSIVSKNPSFVENARLFRINMNCNRFMRRIL